MYLYAFSYYFIYIFLSAANKFHFRDNKVLLYGHLFIGKCVYLEHWPLIHQLVMPLEYVELFTFV